MTEIPGTSRARPRVIVVGAVVPVAVAAAGAILMISWMPELPDPVVTHWNGSEADGYGSPWLLALTPVGVVALFSAFATVTSWSPTARGLLTLNQKGLLVTGSWMSVLLTTGIAGSLLLQRGRGEVADQGGGDAVGLFLLLGAVIGLALAVSAWFLLPRVDTEYAETPGAEPLTVGDGERVSWSRTVRLGTVASAVVGASLLLTFSAVVVTAITASRGLWIAAGVLALVLLLVLATATWRVSADRRGLIVRSGLGWPRVVIPTEDIRQASAITVSASADFGGWGWRWDAAGRQGIIMRSGSAIQVTRASGRRFVVTVDDAATGASVLAAVTGAAVQPTAPSAGLPSERG